MNKIAICYLSYIAVREQPSHKAQMVTQLIFGEDYLIIETQNDWCLIQCRHDNYQGWIPEGQVFYLPDNLNAQYLEQYNTVTAYYFHIHAPDTGNIIRLSPGSKLPFYMPDKQLFNYQTNWIKIVENTLIHQHTNTPTVYGTKESMLTAMSEFYGTPYLWGGRTIWGIDCSGLVQISFRLLGIQLPRDAYQQAESNLGKTIKTLNKAQSCDVAFFSSTANQERITHVGILLSPQKILHASNYVQTDMLDDTGIYKSINTTDKHYTHYLKCIKRFL